MRNSSTKIAGVAIASLYFLYCLVSPNSWHFIDGVNLIFHEAGHTIFGLLGSDFIGVAGGTLMQLLIPFFIAMYFWKQREPLSSMVTLAWGGQSLVNVYVYAADAQHMELELLGGADVIHDWNYLLTALHVIEYTPQIASLIYMIATVCICGATAYASYLVLSPEWNSKMRR